MKNTFLSIFFIFFFIGVGSYAQTLTLFYNLENGFGFKNDKGDTIVEPKYQEAHDFQNGFASVQINDKWGFINSKGKEVIECQYESVYEGFSKYGFARVYQNEYGYLYIDTLGKPCNFTRIYDTIKNRAWVDFINGGMGIVDLITREEIYKCYCDGGSLQFSETGLMEIYNPDAMYIDINGKEIK